MIKSSGLVITIIKLIVLNFFHGCGFFTSSAYSLIELHTLATSDVSTGRVCLCYVEHGANLVFSWTTRAVERITVLLV